MVTRIALGVLVAAVLLTAAVASLYWRFVPASGFIRSFHATGDFGSAPSTVNRTTEVNLAFLTRGQARPRQSFGVQWKGFWHLADERTIEFKVASNDDVELLIDSKIVILRTARVGPQVLRRAVTLKTGTHEIVVRYRQQGRGMGLSILARPQGGRAAPLPTAEIFVEPIGESGVAISAAMPWMTILAGVVWLAAAGLAIAGRLSGARADRRLAALTRNVFVARLRLTVGPALLVPIVLFQAAPLMIHAANREEFAVPFTAVLWPWTIGAVVVVWGILIALAAPIALISQRLTQVHAAVLLAVGLLLWAQGTWLVADYGPLYGETLDLRAHDGRVPYETALWGVVLALAVVFATRVARVVPFVSIVFAVLQLGAIVMEVPSMLSTRERANDAWSSPPTRLYSLSRTENVIHLVLDAYLSELFGEAAAQNRAHFDRAFSGFVFFADHLGAFPTTRASMPAMLSGAVYRNEEPFEQFRSRTVLRRSIATVLAEHGYEVRSVSFHRSEHPTVAAGAVVRFTIPTPYGRYEDHVRFTALQLFDLATFRSVPHAFKASVYRDGAWLWQRSPLAGPLERVRARTERPSNHVAFLSEMADRLTADATDRVFQFIHVAAPHAPVVLDDGCSFIDRRATSRSAYAAQSRCVVRVVEKFLDRLRALDIYDQSIVIITSDHGWRARRAGHPLAGVTTPAGDLQSVALAAMPLLAVKPKHVSGPLRISMAPTAISDVPATIADLAGLAPGLFPGESAMRIDAGARRQRSFAYHSWRNADWRRKYIDALHVFTVDGPIHRPGSWRYEQTIGEPGATERRDR